MNPNNLSVQTVQTASSTSGYGYNIWINSQQSNMPMVMQPQATQVQPLPAALPMPPPMTGINLQVAQALMGILEEEEPPDPAEVEAAIEHLLEMRRKFS